MQGSIFIRGLSTFDIAKFCFESENHRYTTPENHRKMNCQKQGWAKLKWPLLVLVFLFIYYIHKNKFTKDVAIYLF